MKRNLIDRCIDWKNSNSQFPFYLTGARGVGKTYLALEFAKAFYDVILYLNFETDSYLSQKLYGLSGDELIQAIYRYNERNEKASFLSLPYREKSALIEADGGISLDRSDQEQAVHTILILDEIGSCSCLEQILMTFIHKRPEVRLFMINSSITEPACLNNGMIEVIRQQCYPLDFEEFLQATGNEWYIGVIYEHFDSNQPLPEIVHKELLELYDIYMVVGGLPEAVSEYLTFGNINNIAEKHRMRYGSMIQDIYSWESSGEALKMKQILETIPIQLQKKNKKFQYKYIRKGVTRLMYENAMESLIQTRQVLVSQKMSVNSSIQLYLFDTGMLASMIRSGKESITVYESEKIQEALLYNSVAQALACKENELHFWESESIASIAYVIGNRNLLPIELFLTDHTRSKNLSVFKEQYQFDYAIKLSPRNFSYQKHVKYVPYYAVFCL